MYEVHFYKDADGNEPVHEYVKMLKSKNDKDSRIKLNKIRDYIEILKRYGTRAGEPYVKHIEGDLWELRPLRDRFFFIGWNGECFILLHHFMKKSQQTPKREIEKAKRNMHDLLERSQYHEQK